MIYPAKLFPPRNLSSLLCVGLLVGGETAVKKHCGETRNNDNIIAVFMLRYKPPTCILIDLLVTSIHVRINQAGLPQLSRHIGNLWHGTTGQSCLQWESIEMTKKKKLLALIENSKNRYLNNQIFFITLYSPNLV